MIKDAATVFVLAAIVLYVVAQIKLEIKKKNSWR